MQIDAHPLVAEFHAQPLAHVQIDCLNRGAVFGDEGLTPEPEWRA